jgi:hypothetical protein
MQYLGFQPRNSTFTCAFVNKVLILRFASSMYLMWYILLAKRSIRTLFTEDLMETGCGVQVKAMRFEFLPSCNNDGVGRLVQEETHPVEDVPANGDVGHASKLIALGGQEVRAVDNPVIAIAVEPVLFTHGVGQHLAGRVFLVRNKVGFSLHSQQRCSMG